MEREVAATRAGATAADGAVAQVEVNGLIATAYDHYDSRSGRPALAHARRDLEQGADRPLDGRWRSLDGRPMHAAMVALSELYEAVLADHLTRMFGVEWEARDQGPGSEPGVGDRRGVAMSWWRSSLIAPAAHRCRDGSASSTATSRRARAAAVAGDDHGSSAPRRRARPGPRRRFTPSRTSPPPGGSAPAACSVRMRPPGRVRSRGERGAAAAARRRCAAGCDRVARRQRGRDGR